jgi:hypothetical protein
MLKWHVSLQMDIAFSCFILINCILLALFVDMDNSNICFAVDRDYIEIRKGDEADSIANKLKTSAYPVRALLATARNLHFISLPAYRFIHLPASIIFI